MKVITPSIAPYASLANQSIPATPTSGVALYAASDTGRAQPWIIDPTGAVAPIQMSLGYRQIQMWAGQAAATTISSYGNGPPPIVPFGTATARTQTSVSLLTAMMRTGIVSAATAASLASVTGSVKVWRGNSNGLGGFNVVMRFGISDAAIVGTANMFVGVISAGTIMNTDVAPDTKANLIGVGCNSGDTHLQLYAAGNAAQARVDLGPSFPVNTTGVEVYELTLYAPPNATFINYRVRRVATGVVATGTISAAASLPDVTTFLGPQFFRSNGGTAAAVGIDLLDMYLEACAPPARWFAAWGDSLTAGSFSTAGNDYPNRLSVLTGYGNMNGGIGGNTSTQIMTRMTADPPRFAMPAIIWAGRNNFNAPTTVKADIATMVAALGHSHYLVLSILNGDTATEYVGGSDYALITGINADLATIYSSHYLDVRPYLVSLYNPGIPQDVIDHGHDVPPSSLRGDYVHLNDAGYQAVANFVYASRSTLGMP